MYFEKKLYKLLNEADDVLDKMIKYKDGDGNEKEATVGGILKQGKDHPAHDDAQKTYDASKGDGGGEEPKKPAPKIDANPFGDEPAGEEPDDDGPKAAPEKSAADEEILDFIGTIADAGERGAGFGDERVRSSVTRDLQQVKDKGGTVDDIADVLKKEAEYMNPEDFELADQAAEEIYGEKIPHGISDEEIGTALESKQPFKENYNRLFKGLGVSKGMRK
jgi:hypothetical protein